MDLGIPTLKIKDLLETKHPHAESQSRGSPRPWDLQAWPGDPLYLLNVTTSQIHTTLCLFTAIQMS